MDRRHFLKQTATGVAAGYALGQGLWAGPQSGPNLVLIISDQFRFDAMGCAGNGVVRTPHLDGLAAEGVRFTHAYSACPVCAPARASILTGRTIYSHGVITNTEAAPQESPEDGGSPPLPPTLDGLLAANGYRCRWNGKWHDPTKWTSPYDGFQWRFNTQKTGMMDPGYKEWLLKNFPEAAREPVDGENRSDGTCGFAPYRMNAMDPRYGLHPGASPMDPNGKPVKITQPDYHGCLKIPAAFSETAFQAGLAIENIRALAATGKPFALTCSLSKPHAPMLPTEPYSGMYAPEAIPLPPNLADPMENSPYRIANGWANLPAYRDPAKVRQWTSDYYGLVKEVDDWVGKILGQIRESGIEGNTLVVFLSDHGEMLGAHGLREKNVFYEESVRVPLIMKFPGKIPPGQTVATPVSHRDILPTILDLFNLKDSPCDGISLKPHIHGAGAPDRLMVSEWANDRVPGFMVIQKGWKLLIGRTKNAPSLDALYHLKDDPFEMTNLIGKNPNRETHRAKAEELKGALLIWLEATASPFLEGVRSRPVMT